LGDIINSPAEFSGIGSILHQLALAKPKAGASEERIKNAVGQMLQGSNKAAEWLQNNVALLKGIQQGKLATETDETIRAIMKTLTDGRGQRQKLLQQLKQQIYISPEEIHSYEILKETLIKNTKTTGDYAGPLNKAELEEIVGEIDRLTQESKEIHADSSKAEVLFDYYINRTPGKEITVENLMLQPVSRNINSEAQAEHILNQPGAPLFILSVGDNQNSIYISIKDADGNIKHNSLLVDGADKKNVKAWLKHYIKPAMRHRRRLQTAELAQQLRTQDRQGNFKDELELVRKYFLANESLLLTPDKQDAMVVQKEQTKLQHTYTVMRSNDDPTHIKIYRHLSENETTTELGFVGAGG